MKVGRLTAGADVLEADVLVGGAGLHVECTLTGVVQAIAAAHCNLGHVITAQRTHTLSREAIRRLDAGAAVATRHLAAWVLQS